MQIIFSRLCLKSSFWQSFALTLHCDASRAKYFIKITINDNTTVNGNKNIPLSTLHLNYFESWMNHESKTPNFFKVFRIVFSFGKSIATSTIKLLALAVSSLWKHTHYVDLRDNSTVKLSKTYIFSPVLVQLNVQTSHQAEKLYWNANSFI